jgi:hypothetical protein
MLLANAIMVLALPQNAAPSTAASAPKPIEKSIEQLAPPMKAAKVIEQKPVLRPNAKRSLIQFGPFTLPASDVC